MDAGPPKLMGDRSDSYYGVAGCGDGATGAGSTCGVVAGFAGCGSGLTCFSSWVFSVVVHAGFSVALFCGPQTKMPKPLTYRNPAQVPCPMSSGCLSFRFKPSKDNGPRPRWFKRGV